MLALGIDLGSTTVKYVLLNAQRETLARAYVRHKSDVRGTLLAVVLELVEKAGAADPVRVLFSGSGALGLAEALQAPFVQEVVADALYLKERAPELDCAIELGGEDAKLLFLSNGVELRMNEACAGGTGAFIDQMAALLETDATGLDALARSAAKSHPMASRCGVFAKTDVVALLNAGVPKSEVARSVFDAVAEQTIGGLACGRSVKGSVGFLGGPLGFLPGLVDAFVRRLGPANDYKIFEDARYAVARGAALAGLDPKEETEAGEARTGRVWSNLSEFVLALQAAHPHSEGAAPLAPLFKTDAERRAFDERHAAERAPRIALHEACGPLYLGVDLGSTTVKAVVIDEAGRVVCDWYEPNEGNPLERLYDRAARLLDEIPEGAHLRSACTTGYGAELAKAALGAPFSEVETLAHQRGATAFLSDVSYVIDIGGQDMKCLKVEKGLIAGVALNEACSSGCGSFLQTFARQLGLTLSDFVEAAMRSRHPCDLGTRCTVFMNSKVRQAQRDGAPIEDIAAGLCRSIVKHWSERAAEVAGRGDARTWAKDARKMVADFMAIERTAEPKPRVGIVGEILLKYHPRANLDIVDEILREGAEPRLGDISSFVLYCLYDRVHQAAALEGPKLPALGAKLLIAHFERMRRAMAEALEGTPLAGVSTLKDDLETVRGWVSPGQEAGEGWLLTAEMLSFVAEGTPNVVCLQPFGCLPNHITGKGVMRAIRLRRPGANLCAIDFEAGTSRANVANRLKLFLAQARESFAGGAEPISGEVKKVPEEERIPVPAHDAPDASSEAPKASEIAAPETKAERDAQPEAYEDRDRAAS